MGYNEPGKLSTSLDVRADETDHGDATVAVKVTPADAAAS